MLRVTKYKIAENGEILYKIIFIILRYKNIKLKFSRDIRLLQYKNY